MSKFRKAVKSVAEQFDMEEWVVAEVFLNLLKARLFSWEAL